MCIFTRFDFNKINQSYIFAFNFAVWHYDWNSLSARKHLFFDKKYSSSIFAIKKAIKKLVGNISCGLEISNIDEQFFHICLYKSGSRIIYCLRNLNVVCDGCFLFAFLFVVAIDIVRHTVYGNYIGKSFIKFKKNLFIFHFYFSVEGNLIFVRIYKK